MASKIKVQRKETKVLLSQACFELAQEIEQRKVLLGTGRRFLRIRGIDAPATDRPHCAIGHLFAKLGYTGSDYECGNVPELRTVTSWEFINDIQSENDVRNLPKVIGLLNDFGKYAATQKC